MVAMEEEAMATSREVGAMEEVATEEVGDTVVMEAVGGTVVTEEVAMEAIVEEVRDAMMMVSMLASQLLGVKVKCVALIQAGYSLSFSRLVLQGMVARATAVPCAPSTSSPTTHTPTTVLSARKETNSAL